MFFLVSLYGGRRGSALNQRNIIDECSEPVELKGCLYYANVKAATVSENTMFHKRNKVIVSPPLYIPFILLFVVVTIK